MVLLVPAAPAKFSIADICEVVPPPLIVTVLLLIDAVALAAWLNKIPLKVETWFTPAPVLLLIVL